MNSFKAVQRGLEYEVQRQSRILSENGEIVQETRRWDEEKEMTVGMRGKEEAHDYRYFPEPDLPPLIIKNEWIEKIRKSLPELPDERIQRYVNEYGIPEYDAEVITASKSMADFFEACVSLYNKPKVVSNWIMGELSMHLNAAKIELKEAKVTPQNLVELLNLIDRGTISGKIAKQVFEEMFKSGKSAEEIVAERGLVQISDEGQLAPLVKKVVSENTRSVEDYINGKKKALGFLVGQVMRLTRGKANPQLVNKLLQKELAGKK